MMCICNPINHNDQQQFNDEHRFFAFHTLSHYLVDET
jgi:hypothetical protein